MRYLHRISGIDGVQPSASPRIKMPVNRRYHGIKFFTTQAGAPVAVTTILDRVRLYVNGATMRDVSAARLLRIAQLNGLTLALGELALMFSESWRADKVDEQMLAWDLFGETSFEIELVFTAALNPGVTGLASFDYGQTLVNGAVAKNIIRQVEVSKNANAGLNDFDNLPVRDPIHRVLLDCAQTINSVEVTADRNKVQETTKAQNARTLADFGLDATAFEYPVCFDFTERIEDALRVQKDLNVRFDLAVAAPVIALVESRVEKFE